MRLLHTSDWHLGQELYGVDRIVEQSRVLDAVIDVIAARDVDVLLISGDVYHVANPSTRAQKLFYQTLARLSREAPNLRIAAIAGNHDSPSRLELPLALPLEGLAGPDGAPRLWIQGAVPRAPDGASDWAACARVVRTPNGAPLCGLALIPFQRPGDLPDAAAATEAFATAADAARRALDAAGAPEAPVILAAHLTAQGGALSPDSERPVEIGGVDALPLSVFPAASDYVALGHLHRPQTLQAEAPAIRYAGSLSPLSATERDYPHGVTLVEFAPGRAPRIEPIALPRPRAFLREPQTGAATVETLEAALRARADEARAATPPPPELTPFLEVEVRLEQPEPDLRARLEAALGDAPLRLTRIRRSRAEAATATEEPPDLADLGPEAAFERLHRETFGAPPPEPLSKAFRALLAADAPADDPRA